MTSSNWWVAFTILLLLFNNIVSKIKFDDKLFMRGGVKRNPVDVITDTVQYAVGLGIYKSIVQWNLVKADCVGKGCPF